MFGARTYPVLGFVLRDRDRIGAYREQIDDRRAVQAHVVRIEAHVIRIRAIEDDLDIE